ncbi:MAG: hypothetical protein HZA01_05415 [Nitrospinae bacterium]|nr:hypothetical protein [Nitrospinota bacterium]
MKILEKAIELTATIDAQRKLVLDAPLPLAGPTRVRVIILLPEDSEMDEKEWLHSAAVNQSFAFLNEPEEDIYNLGDGKPFQRNKT